MLDKLDTSTLGFPNAFPFQVSLGLCKLWLCHFVFLTWTWKQPRVPSALALPVCYLQKDLSTWAKQHSKQIQTASTWQDGVPKQRGIGRKMSKETYKVPMPTFIFYRLSGKHAENIQVLGYSSRIGSFKGPTTLVRCQSLSIAMSCPVCTH